MKSCSTTSDPCTDVEIKPIPGWEGLYKASSDGHIFSEDRIVPSKRWGTMTLKGRKLRQHPRANGYLKVSLCRESRPTCRSVHLLVALTFIGPRPNGHDIDHKNRDKQDNRAINLRYVTRSINKLNNTAKGCSFYKGKWIARLYYQRTSIYIGQFETEEEAHAAYLKFKKEFVASLGNGSC